MKLVYIITFVTLVSAELETRNILENKVLQIININELVDRYTPHISQFIIKNGLDPLKLPSTAPQILTLSSKLASTNYNGYLTLHSGILRYLSSVERYGDATLSYEDKILKIDIGVKFQLLKAAYNYVLKLFIFNKTGRVLASTRSVNAKINIMFNTTDYTLALNKFELQMPGRINVIVQNKDGKIDWIITSITNVITPLFKNTITKTIQTKATNAIQTFFNEINGKMSRETLMYIFEYDLLKYLNV